jgi:hypothetical protein
VNLADSGDNIVDFDLSESKYTSNQILVKIESDTPRNGSGQKQDPALMSMDSMDFGLSESNMSFVNLSMQRSKLIRSSTEKLPANTSKNVSNIITVEKEEGEEEYSQDFD